MTGVPESGHDRVAPEPPPKGSLRVALIGPLPPPAGGMANQTRQLAELLSLEGVDVELIQTNPPYRPAWIGRVRGLRAMFRLVPYLFTLWRALGRCDVGHLMANSGWSWHLFAAPAVWLAQARGTPLVVNYRGGEADIFLRKQHRWVLPTLRRAQALVVPSGFLEQVFRRFGVAPLIIPNIIDLKRFSGAAGVPTAPGPHLVVTRNLEPIYGIDTAIRAMALLAEKHSEAHMSIAGSGPEAGRLKELARVLGLEGRVAFTGRLDPDQVAALYRAATVFLNPSRVDNMPNSLLEALSAGVPIVTTDVGGIPYMVEDGRTALMVGPDSPEALAAAVSRIISEPALRATLVDEGGERAARYTWNNVGPQWLGLYGRLGGKALEPASPGRVGT